MKEIVILDGYCENPGDLSWSGFETLGKLTVYDRTPPADIISRIGDAEIVYTNKTPLTAETIAACPNLKYIGVLATGYNVVDTQAARAHGVAVTNIPVYGTVAVAQMVFALLLEICHHAGHHSEAVKSGRWSDCPDFCFWDYPLIELSGKTLGIVGLGRIGIAAAKIARAFGMDVVAHDKYESAEGSELAEYLTLEELYARSDVISLHCPLFPENTGMISTSSIARMRDGVILINTSRGGLVNEADLAAALNSGKVYYAGLDVVSKEPISPDNPLLGVKNAIITPHIAWAPKESRVRLMDVAADNLRAFLEGRAQNVVNL